jgi:hypothetical protein
MSRHGYGGYHGGGGWEGLVVGFALLAAALVVITFVLLVRSVVYVVQTFNRYGSESKGLQKSLKMFLFSLVLAGIGYAVLYMLKQQSLEQYVGVLPAIGYLQLLTVCKVVQTNFNQTFLKQGYSITADVLRKDWWSSYPDTAMAA